MTEKTITTYIAADDVEFNTISECLTHEMEYYRIQFWNDLGDEILPSDLNLGRYYTDDIFYVSIPSNEACATMNGWNGLATPEDYPANYPLPNMTGLWWYDESAEDWVEVKQSKQRLAYLLDTHNKVSKEVYHN